MRKSDSFWEFVRNFLRFFGEFFEEIFREFLENSLGIFGEFFGNSLEFEGSDLGIFLGIPLGILRSALARSRLKRMMNFCPRI